MPPARRQPPSDEPRPKRAGGRPKGGGKNPLASRRKVPVNLKDAQQRERIRERLIEAFTAGATIDTACNHAGIGETRLRQWWNDDDEFASSCAQARETGIVGSLAVIQTAARNGDWKAAEAFLRLAKPQEYGGPRVVVNQTNSNTASIEHHNVIVEALLLQIEQEIPDPDLRYRLGAKLLGGGAFTGDAAAGIGLDPIVADSLDAS